MALEALEVVLAPQQQRDLEDWESIEAWEKQLSAGRAELDWEGVCRRSTETDGASLRAQPNIWSQKRALDELERRLEQRRPRRGAEFEIPFVRKLRTLCRALS